MKFLMVRLDESAISNKIIRKKATTLGFYKRIIFFALVKIHCMNKNSARR